MFGCLLQRLTGAVTPLHEPARCLRRWRQPCSRCAGACPQGCLEIGSKSNPPLHRKDRCLGCLNCAGVCPSGAFRFPQGIMETWRLFHSGNGPLRVNCGQVYRLERAPVPCLGALSYPVMAYLASLAGGLQLTSADCAGCGRRREGLLERNLAQAGEALSRLDTGVSIQVQAQPATRPAGSTARLTTRRAFLAGGIVQTVEAARGEALEIGAGIVSTLRAVRGDNLETQARRWFLDALRQHPGALPHYLLPFRILRPREATRAEARQALSRCVPGALRLVEVRGSIDLVHQRERCRSCGQGPCPVWPEASRAFLREEPGDRVTLASWTSHCSQGMETPAAEPKGSSQASSRPCATGRNRRRDTAE